MFGQFRPALPPTDTALSSAARLRRQPSAAAQPASAPNCATRGMGPGSDRQRPAWRYCRRRERRRQQEFQQISARKFVAGNAGGITRDVLIGAVPPAALTDVRYLLVSVLAGLVTFYWYSGVDRLRSPVLLFDAAGLSLFAVSGAQKALGFGLDPVAAALLGMLTGIGGGMTRDVLLAEIP